MRPALPGLVVFTPLPPARSGIASYAAELLPALARHLPVAAVVARRAEVVPLPGVEVLAVLDYRARRDLQAWPHLHQVGNSLDHAHALLGALRRPGIVTLHDPVLHHLVEALTLGRGNPAGYEAALVAEHGVAGRRVARLRRRGLFDPSLRWLLPLNRMLLDRQRGVILHSRFAAGRVHRPGGPPLRVIPHHLSPEVPALDGLTRQAVRQRLGLPERAPILLSLGHATPAKRIDLVLEAVARLAGEFPDLLHLVAGAPDPGLDLDGLIARYGLGGRVRVTGWLPEEAFLPYARAADLLVNLRQPQAGETSGALVRALGMGLPAVVDATGPSAEYPDSVVAKLAPGPEPAARLAALIGGMLRDPAGLAARGEAARAHLRRHHALDASARLYLEAIDVWAG
ncbi:glycosyltransferase family 4 protein [Paracraurococcus lichenis]|uniref:Glycosyltransferase family 4 protein n=1 Tax=Paracraurococcus lichenis TaxID=3064888 RepID=A0ABT9DTZ7_9PROT|nr:glycosyltransferase family 4 protein [Paracraurococcus sp. LOR1-02]MDO9707379.1 glycosyltransferase family 4 protein [Paracraurococcus sp. LOR1-02]